MENIKYYFERSYPYIFAGVICIIIKKMNIDFFSGDSLKNALDAVNTIAALIIGFLGAILPVILGMKNESKLVKYVFENDKKRLFLKYIKSNVIIGLLLVFFTVSLYFENKYTWLRRKVLFDIWVFILCAFLLGTYRSLSNMLNLIFSTDDDFKTNGFVNNKEKTQEERGLEDEFEMK